VDTLSYKTQYLNKATVQKEWVVIDATNQPVGRFCSRITLLLRGKNKPGFTPHVDCGDNVIVINAEKIRFTGKKMQDKVYKHHTHHPGGLRTTTPALLLDRKPISIIEIAVKGMLPKNRLGDRLYRNLHVYAGAAHEHEAQQPKEINFNSAE
jgi:large subunit ribosomal protein L13